MTKQSPSPSFRVFLCAPSSPFDQEKLAQGVSFLSHMGFHIQNHIPAFTPVHTYLNGTDEERKNELEKALFHSNADIVWIVRGGYGLTRLLPLLRISSLKKRPVVIGGSDASALLAHLFTHHALGGIHGPMITRLAQEPPQVLQALLLLLEGKGRHIAYPPLQLLSAPTSMGSCITGPLFPSNLCMLTHLIGTPSMPSLAQGILLLEEVGEKPYCIDRMLTHLWASHSLKGVQAVVLGHFTHCGENQGEQIREIFVERLSTWGIAVLGTLPMGHEPPNWPVPFGVQGQLSLKGSKGQLTILEEVG